ncbi:MAG: amidase [Actinobacteria bacterium]|nr:amidase [Actinomycetota bacterium]
MELTIADAGRGLRAGTFSATELLTEVTRLGDRLDGTLNVYVARFDESARRAAAAADRELAAGLDRGPLHGIPVGVKDLIFTREGPTLAGTDVRNPAWQRPTDAAVVSNLRAAGAVITGKTTTAELAVGTPEAGRLERESRNPWDADRWAGGSSAGSGAGVAAGMFAAGIGSDTGGSIRLPAAYCGIVGLRPTFGLVPRAGTIALSPSLDVVGPLTRTAADSAVVLRALAGADGADRAGDLSRELGRSLRGLRLGVERVPEAGSEMAACLDAAVEELAGAGAEVREVELPHYEPAVSAVLVTLFAEGFAEHTVALREQWSSFGVSTRRILAQGALLSAADYVNARKARGAVRRLVIDLYRDLDVIVSATAIAEAPPLDAIDLDDLTATIRTDYWSAIGNPVISVPIGFGDRDMPLGMQIAGRPFEDATVLGVADAYQQLTDWHQRVPPMVAAERGRA